MTETILLLLLMSPHSSTESHSSSRLDLSFGSIHCCTLLPPLCAHGHQVSCCCCPTSCTTTNSSRFDSLSVCLGWMCCCTPLPPLSPLCAHGPQATNVERGNYGVPTSPILHAPTDMAAVRTAAAATCMAVTWGFLARTTYPPTCTMCLVIQCVAFDARS